MITPNNVQKGDTIAIVATAKAIEEKEVLKAKSVFESWGLNVKLGDHVFDVDAQFAGTDENRLNDIQSALDDNDIKTVIFARGGYGTTRILDQIDFTKFKSNPKWLCGFSDITALIGMVNNLGYEAVHSSMPIFFNLGLSEASIESIKKVLFKGRLDYSVDGNNLNIEGGAEGEIVGGNLSMICNSIGTSSEISTYGKILFLEDLTEYLYHIDRMMVQLDRSGKLENLSGLIVGHFSTLLDNEVPFGRSAYEIILEHCGKYDYPIAFGFPVGHEPENMSIICGRESKLVINKDKVLLHQ